MRRAWCSYELGMFLVAFATLTLPSVALGQDVETKAQRPVAGAPGSAKADIHLQGIEDEYNLRLRALNQSRLDQLGALAARQQPAAAAATYERLFRLAIEDNLFKYAEAAAGKVLEQGTPSSTTNALAHLTKLIAEVDRGAFDQSLGSVRQALADSTQERPATATRAVLAPTEVIEIFEAYYQRLVDANQYAIAREALRLALEKPYRPAFKDFLSSRLKRIELVGNPAPPIQGKDLDGKEFNLAGHKGKLVLVVFWASWCLPNAAQISWLEDVEHAYHNRGLEVVGINVDVREDGGSKLETVLPNIRRFLLDYNVPWPTIVNGSGDKDFAKAYGVSDIPANILIGRDGKVVQLDLSRNKLESVLSLLLER